MDTAQSPHIPAKGTRPGWTDLPWLARYCARGLFELIRARLIFMRLEAKDIPTRNRRSRDISGDQKAISDSIVARIAYVIPRLSDRLPWRSDCVIQAIAAQNWLITFGAPSEIRIGVELPKDGEFGAHAWLVHEGEVVTGGDIERYHLLLSESGEASLLNNDSHSKSADDRP